MSLFNRGGGNAQQQGQRLTPEQSRDVQGIKADPAGFLRSNYGLDASGNDPFQIMDSLARSGQLDARQMQRYQRIQQMMQRVRR